tara:strand:- start:7885 stop:8550 length:666 start_codon:yes stop_codon:yes gene_type:complete
MIFLTADERPFQKGDYIISHGMEYLPTAPRTTYIVFDKKVSEKTIKKWIDVVSFRLVFVCDKVPKLSKAIKEQIIIHESLNASKQSYNAPLNAMLTKNDRKYAYRLLSQSETPVPLMVSWLRENVKNNPSAWRLLAASAFTLPDTYPRAIAAFCVRPVRGSPKWPKKKEKPEAFEAMGLRESDVYAHELLSLSPDLRNDLRDANPKQDVIGKTQETLTQWL